MRIQKTSIIAIAVAGGLCVSLAVAQELATYPILGGAKEKQPGLIQSGFQFVIELFRHRRPGL